MRQILRLLQLFDKRCTMIISTSDFGELACQCVACIDDTAWSKVPTLLLLSIADRLAIHALSLSFIMLCFQMASASCCETYSWSVESSENSFPPICAAVLSTRLHATCLCSTSNGKVEDLEDEKEELQKEMKYPDPAPDLPTSWLFLPQLHSSLAMDTITRLLTCKTKQPAEEKE